MKRRKSTTALDHIGVVGHDLEAIERAYKRLGFTVAPRSALLKPAPSGGWMPMDQNNHHVLFGNGYVELTAMTKPSPQHHLAPLIARYAGLHIVALTEGSASKSAARVRAAGVTVPDPMGAAREVNYPERQGTAEFRWFKIPDETAGEGLFCYVEHLTRDLVMQRSLMTHENGATELAHITLCVKRPRVVARRYARFFGMPAREGGTGLWFDLAIGKLRIIDRDQLGALYPRLKPPMLPWLVGFTVRTADLKRAAGILKSRGVDVRGKGDKRFWVHPDDASGVAVGFIPARG